jgi:hypothetical protein
MPTQWEYLTIFVRAEAKNEEDYLREHFDWKSGIPRNAPEAMIPQLNSLGERGWELVHMQPVIVGDNRDVMIFDPSGTRNWTSSYFCVFKRPKEE